LGHGEAMNWSYRQLAASGCRVIQVEEPTLHFMAATIPEQKELLDFLVDAFNREVEGWTTWRFGSTPAGAIPTCRRCSATSPMPTRWESTWERLKGDVWTIEATENNFRELSLFDSLQDRLKKKIAWGGQPSLASGRFSGCRGRADPALSAAHSRRQARAVDRLRVRPWRIQPAPGVLQDDRHPAGAQSGAQGTGRRAALPCRPPTSGSPGDLLPIKSRSHTSSRCAEVGHVDRLQPGQEAYPLFSYNRQAYVKQKVKHAAGVRVHSLGLPCQTGSAAHDKKGGKVARSSFSRWLFRESASWGRDLIPRMAQARFRNGRFGSAGGVGRRG